MNFSLKKVKSYDIKLNKAMKTIGHSSIDITAVV